MRRKRLSQFSSSELIAIARKAIANGKLGSVTFKETYDVDFSFLQLCNSLYKRRICGRRIMSYEEYNEVKNGMKKSGLNGLFLEIQERYEDYLFDAVEKIP